ncbi:hypothetical protein J1N35_005481 [Gossypium stocksii]|uniref:Uncharacterized protein n=1 Tax=Gossypium stocksii TaxID=47602 RepID=A0A9D3WDW4_9ROSI|nr:hypothetical protein J1N35_005481 [Gossypium stocksii]
MMTVISKLDVITIGKSFMLTVKRNGTNALKPHMITCVHFPLTSGDPTQTTLVSQPGDGSLSDWKFDQNVIRRALVMMILVEGWGFRNLMEVACPRFCMPSR